MHKQYIVGGYRILFACLVAAAIVAQFLYSNSKGHFDAVNFFSFFTIESNIFAAALFLVTGILLLAGKSTARFGMLRGAATLYMVTTGVVYALLLSNLDTSLQVTLPWVNDVLHRLMPVVVLLDWFIDRTQMRISFRRALWWLAFPVAFVVYSLIRGHVVGWYPYPFLDPAARGYGYVVLMCGAMILVALVFMWFLSWTTNAWNKPAKTRKSKKTSPRNS